MRKRSLARTSRVCMNEPVVSSWNQTKEYTQIFSFGSRENWYGDQISKLTLGFMRMTTQIVAHP